MLRRLRPAVRPLIAAALSFICLIYSDQIRIGSQKNRSFDVALFCISSCAERVSILSQRERFSFSNGQPVKN